MLLVISVQSQDVHFSQFWANPLLLNPAFSGNSGCSIFAGIDYRSQGGSISTPYVTEAAVIDGRIWPSFTGNSWFGFGITFYSDKAGEVELKTTHAMGYFAYTMSLNRRKTFLASVGFGVGRVTKNINPDKFLTSSNIINIINGQPPGPSNILLKASANYTDFNAGVLVNFKLSYGTKVIAGSSLRHINNPVVTFLDNSTSRLDWNWVFHGLALHSLNEIMDINPGLLVSLMASTKEIIVGSNLNYRLMDIKLIGGLWIRISGDIIPLAGIDYQGLVFLCSYDANISRLNPASGFKGGYEFSLVKTFGCSMERHRKYERCRNFEYSENIVK
jgi:type IX secretion system PorP/SprF family membrane protein